MVLSGLQVTEGEWHHLLIELKNVKEDSEMKHLVTMTLDYGMDQVSWHLPSFGDRPFLWPRKKQNDPLMFQDLPEILWMWGGTFWDPQWASVLPCAEATGIFTSSFTQMRPSCGQLPPAAFLITVLWAPSAVVAFSLAILSNACSLSTVSLGY